LDASTRETAKIGAKFLFRESAARRRRDGQRGDAAVRGADDELEVPIPRDREQLQAASFDVGAAIARSGDHGVGAKLSRGAIASSKAASFALSRVANAPRLKARSFADQATHHPNPLREAKIVIVGATVGRSNLRLGLPLAEMSHPFGSRKRVRSPFMSCPSIT
jgi:hypothetical protein